MPSVPGDKSPGTDGISPRILKEMLELQCVPLNIIFKHRHINSTETAERSTQNLKKETQQCPLHQSSVRQTYKDEPPGLWITTWLHYWEKRKHKYIRSIGHLEWGLDAQHTRWCHTVPHQRLLKQVESFGIKDKALAWTTAFLDDRRQKVSVHGEQSNWCSVLSGIPQGSVLGPILFTMFVSDVPGIMNNLTSMFADDTKLYATLTDDNN